MPLPNPYRPPDSHAESVEHVAPPPSRAKWMFVGWLMFSALPFGLGVTILYAESRVAATLPPGTARCGMGALGALMLMGISPIFGLLGTCAGAIAFAMVPQKKS